MILCRTRLHSNVGVLLFLVAYVYAFSVSKEKTEKKFSAARSRIRISPRHRSINVFTVMSPLEIFWTMLSSLVIELAYLSVIAVLFLYYFNYTIVGSVHTQLNQGVCVAPTIDLKKVLAESPTAISVAIGDFLRPEVLAIVGYSFAVTLVFTVYYAMFLKYRSTTGSEKKYDEFVSLVYMVNISLVGGGLVHTMLA